MKTTIGRKVWFFAAVSCAALAAASAVTPPDPGGKPGVEADGHKAGKQAKAPKFTLISDDAPCDATVIYVWSDDLVNLKVTDHAGVDHIFTSVHLAHAVEDKATRHGVADRHGTAGFHAVWMPYQTSQSRKDFADRSGPPDVVLKKTHDNGEPVTA